MMKSLITVVRTRTDLRAAVADLRTRHASIGFVPTMGALHDGHISLVSLARNRADAVVASIFVNPAQFAPGEDLETYPRTEAEDVARLEAAGCVLVYCPTADEMYPPGSSTNVRVDGLSDLLDGIHRPHFFYGVTTVVARLFSHVAPDIAVFGEKDYQQLQIIRRMVRDLGMDIEIVGGPTQRDGDGLAQSSRNAYLSDSERRNAGALFASLHRAAKRIEAGTAVERALYEAKILLAKGGFDGVDYVSAVAPDTLEDLPAGPAAPGTEGRLLGAARIGKTRLIDNIGFMRPE